MAHVTHAIPLAAKLNEHSLKEIEQITSDLKKAGISLHLGNDALNPTLVFNYDSTAYKRSAGRKRKPLPLTSDLAEMAPEQIDGWLLDNSIEVIQKELGVGRATAYRRRAEARSRIEYATILLD